VHVLSATGLSRTHDGRTLFSDVAIGIATGDRIGLVGPNGSGKSTLLRILAGVERPDAGDVVFSDNARIGWLPQEPDLPDVAAVEAVLSLGDGAVRQHEAEALLSRLGVPLDLPTGEMSGGQRRRVALAGTLLPPSDLLVLDEPTNHLDVWTVDWLEDELRRRASALLLVSHDRRMLEDLTTRMLELDPDGLDPTGVDGPGVPQAGGGAYWHEGGYSAVLQARAERSRRRDRASQQRASVLRKEVAWLQRQPKARTSKPKFRTEQAHALQASAGAGEQVQLQLGTGRRRLGSRVIDAEGVRFRYSPDGPDVVKGFDAAIGPGQRIGVVGPNGAGKTTLLRLLCRELEPSAGTVGHGPTVELGIYRQEAVVPPSGASVLDTIEEVGSRIPLANGETLSASKLAERFLFDPRLQRTAVRDLSGGERRRLALLRMLVAAPNVMVLDEPTNDLDLDTLAVLEDHLDGFGGTLLVASHDRFVLDRLTDELYAVDPDGSVSRHLDWARYREAVEHERALSGRASSGRGGNGGSGRGAGGGGASDAARARERLLEERRNLRQLESRMTRLTGLRDQLDAALVAAGSDPARVAELARARDGVVTELAEVEQAWLEASVEET